LKPTLLLLAAAASLALPALASPIFITNANFNNQTVGTNTYVLAVQSWPGEVGGTAPVTSTETAPFPIADLPPGGGPNVAILGDFNGGFGYIFQTLATAWAANTTYTLGFYVGDPAGVSYNGYLVTLNGGSSSPGTAGPTILASDNTAISGITAGNWAHDTLTFATGAVAPAGDITIELGTTPVGGATGYDLITLDAVTNSSSAPEPGAWILVAAGLALLAFTRVIRASAPTR
jgi:MYXO-CTERM domain-containing protein